MVVRTDLRISYGIADFRRIRNEGFHYVDKMAYLAKMEERDSFVFFIRPRRFGNSQTKIDQAEAADGFISDIIVPMALKSNALPRYRRSARGKMI